MPLKKVDCSDKALDQSTFALTISSISSPDSQTNFPYDQQFTLNPILKEAAIKQRESCLAMKIAQTFPQRIKQEVTKMVDYYENAVSHQYKQFHRLIEENNRLKKENQKMKAQVMANQLNANHYGGSGKQMRQPFQAKSENVNEDSVWKQRSEQLQEKVMLRDKKINELNGQLGDLMIKVKKYKKKCEIKDSFEK